jgi:hypothetical protein
MAYRIFYIISFLFVIYIWFLKPVFVNDFTSYEEPVSEQVQVDSTFLPYDYSDSGYYQKSKDTIVILREPTEKVIYVKEENKSLIGLSNELITLIVGVMNIVVMGIQLKNKK